MITHPIRRFQRSLKRSGVAETMKLCLKGLLHPRKYHLLPGLQRLDEEFDSRFGVDTASVISLADLDVTGENQVFGVSYWPTTYQKFRELLAYLPIRPENFTFIDFGSGKGKALLMASEFPFNAVIGIEISKQLCEAASHNILSFISPSRTCTPVELLCMDAASFTIPPDRLVCYFYNPFEEPVMAQVVQRLEDSLREVPRDVFVVYLNPICGRLFDNSRLFARFKAGTNCRPLPGGQQSYSIWRSVAPQAAQPLSAPAIASTGAWQGER